MKREKENTTIGSRAGNRIEPGRHRCYTREASTLRAESTYLLQISVQNGKTWPLRRAELACGIDNLPQFGIGNPHVQEARSANP